MIRLVVVCTRCATALEFTGLDKAHQLKNLITKLGWVTDNYTNQVCPSCCSKHKPLGKFKNDEKE